jgi:hypothetical protein
MAGRLLNNPGGDSMIRFTSVSFRAVGSLLVPAAAVLLIAGCGPSNSSSSGSPGSGGSTSTPATTAPAQSSGGGTTLFPATVGNTWVYSITDAAGVGTTTNRVTAVHPVADGNRVTISSSESLPDIPSTTTSLTYIFHTDGSITVPYVQTGTSTSKVTISSGSIIWPSQSVLDSGQVHHSTLVVKISSAALTTKVSAHVTVKGDGTSSVTVPAGTYNATLVSETITEAVEGIKVSITVDTWLAPGVGPIKSELLSGSVGSKPSFTEVLKSFTKG